jgi:hypothetical protein
VTRVERLTRALSVGRDAFIASEERVLAEVEAWLPKT